MSASRQPALLDAPELGGPLRNLWQVRTDPLGLALRARAEVGDVVRVRFGIEGPIFVFAPTDVRRVLVDNQVNYQKRGGGWAMLRGTLGDGLLTSEGATWRRQRRIAQPAFQRERLSKFGEAMIRAARDHADAWRKRAETGEPFDVAADMMRLTLRIVGLALFGEDLSRHGDVVGSAVNDIVCRFRRSVALPFAVDWPTPANLRARRALTALDRIVYGVIAERRKGRGEADLLGMLIDARYEESGEAMGDRQLRDEIITILLAGHETTANALAWTLYLLGKHPEALRRVEEELDRVLGGAPPRMEELAALTYTEQALCESLRLYPPVWVISRQAADDDVLGGVRVRAGSQVLLSPYVTHRDPGVWQSPERFEPDRFAADKTCERDKHAFFPFGAGPRKCLGDHFAHMEALVVLATLLGRFRVELCPGQRIVPEASVTLRPRGAIRVRIHAR